MADQDKEIVIRVSAKNLTKGEFDSVRKSVQGVSSDIEKQRGMLGGMTSSLKSVAGLMGVTFGIGAVVGFTKHVFDSAEQISDLSARMGIGTTAAQQFAHAARQTGGDLEGVSKSIIKMNDVLASPTKGTIDALKIARLELDDLRKMKPEDAFKAIVAAVEKIPNPMQQTQVTLELLGKSGATLLPAIRSGFLGVAEGAATMSEETIKRLDDAKDAWGNFFNQITIWSGTVLGNLTKDLGNMYDLLRGIGPAAAGFQKLFGDVKATAGGFLSGGFAGAGAAHAGYMGNLKQQQLAELEAADIKKLLASENKKLSDSTAWLSGKTGELTQAQKDAKAAAEAQRKAIEGLVDEMSGTKLRGEITQLNAAFAKMTAEQKAAPENLDRMLAKIKPLVDAGGLPLLSKEAHDLYIKHLALKDITAQVGGGFDTLLPKTRAFTMEVREQTRTLQEELAVLQQIRDFGSTFINKGPIDLSGAFAATVSLTPPPSVGKTFAQALVRDFGPEFGKLFGPTILSAITGGGDVGKSVGGLAGGFVGQKFTEHFGGVISKGLGKTIGGALGSIIPGLGTLVGAFGGQLVDKLLSVNKNVTKGTRESFAKDVLGFNNLGGLYDDLRKLGAEGEKLAHIGLNVIGRKDEAGNRRWMEDVKKFYDDVKKKQVDQAQAEVDARDKLQATVEKYGFTIEELGPKWQAQRLTEQAQGLLEEMTLLVGSGIDNDTVIRKMAGAYNEYFQTAKKANQEIPIELKATADRMAELGLLVDENGNKFASAEDAGLSFSMTIGQGFKGVIDKLDELIKKITGDLGKAITNTPTVKIDVDDSAIDRAINRPRGGFRLFGGGGEVDVGGAQHGGLFSRPALRVVAEAGPEIVGSPDALVNALAEAMARTGLGAGGGSVTFNVHTPIGTIDTIRQLVYEEIGPLFNDYLANNIRGGRSSAQQILGIPVT
jgi:hypothetical protein